MAWAHALAMVIAAGRWAPPAAGPEVPDAVVTAAASPTTARFGVLAPGEPAWGAQLQAILGDLHAQCVRVNVHLDGGGAGYTAFLAAGLDVVLTCANRDPDDVDTTFGTLAAWPKAGFPYRSEAAYRQRIHDLLQPALPYLAGGRALWLQCENEAIDASQQPGAVYWRGTEDDYLAQLSALAAEARAVSPAIRVVSTSFASETLAAASDPFNARHQAALAWIGALLAAGSYDATDLHFYGCPDDIAAKIAAVRQLLPPGKAWISTENGGPDPRCPATPYTWAADPVRFEQVQAEQLGERLNACAAAGGSVCLYFSLFDLLGEASIFQHLGLLDPSVEPPREKPAYAAFQSFIAERSPHVRRHLSRTVAP